MDRLRCSRSPLTRIWKFFLCRQVTNAAITAAHATSGWLAVKARSTAKRYQDASEAMRFLEHGIGCDLMLIDQQLPDIHGMALGSRLAPFAGSDETDRLAIGGAFLAIRLASWAVAIAEAIREHTAAIQGEEPPDEMMKD